MTSFRLRNLTSVAVAACVAGVLACASTATQNNPLPSRVISGDTQERATQQHQWQAPTYQGLFLGSSTKADVERAFGKPVWSGTPEKEPTDDTDEDELLYEYKDVGGIKGRTSIFLNAGSGVVKAISIYPEQLPAKKAIKRYGGNFVEMNNVLDFCALENKTREKLPLGNKKYEYPIFLERV